MRTLLNTSLDPHYNMAFDSYVLEHTDFEGFYLWQNKPSVIIGLNQSAYAEVNLPFIDANGIELVRRVSGGGAVYHDLGNLNYTFVGYEDGPARVAEALHKLGAPAELTGRNDIMVDGRKCSGYAKRLAGDRIFVHGTLMFDVNLETLLNALSTPGSKLSAAGVQSVRSKVANLKECLPYSTIQEFQAALHNALGGEDPKPLADRQISEIEHIASTKFRSWDWRYGHSPKTDFRSTHRFPCGTITANYSIKHGVISEIAFEGDFIGAKPASELTALLKGRRLQDIASLPVGDWFDSLSQEDFLTLFEL
ncbi:MAG: lipoate--protein ligase [Bacteroidales bacterium]|nr:lipoate--protein ligase [Bacteroidales bacterium]